MTTLRLAHDFTLFVDVVLQTFGILAVFEVEKNHAC
jgi:hypothetical protein